MRCFSSPGSPRAPMDSVRDGPCGPGFPIRKSADQSLLTAPRGLSQRATSFIASRRQGIHQTPFSARDPHPRTACRPDGSVRRQDRGRLGEDSHAPPPWRAAPHRLRNQETHHALMRTTCPNQCLLTMSETALPGCCRTGEPREAGRAPCLLKPGGAGRARTDDLLLAKQALSRLSYGPCPGACRRLAADARPCGRRARDKWWAWIDLNYRPHPYQGCALTD